MHEMETCWCYITEGLKKTQYLFFICQLVLQLLHFSQREMLPSNISSLCFSSRQLAPPSPFEADVRSHPASSGQPELSRLNGHLLIQ